MLLVSSFYPNSRADAMVSISECLSIKFGDAFYKLQNIRTYKPYSIVHTITLIFPLVERVKMVKSLPDANDWPCLEIRLIGPVTCLFFTTVSAKTKE